MHGSRGRRRRLAKARRALMKAMSGPARNEFWRRQCYNTAIATERMEQALTTAFNAAARGTL